MTEEQKKWCEENDLDLVLMEILFRATPNEIARSICGFPSDGPELGSTEIEG